MAETIDTGGRAYPIQMVVDPGSVTTWGMTKLEAYAKAALTGLLLTGYPFLAKEALAAAAFDLACAMLAEAKRLGVTHD